MPPLPFAPFGITKRRNKNGNKEAQALYYSHSQAGSQVPRDSSPRRLGRVQTEHNGNGGREPSLNGGADLCFPRISLFGFPLLVLTFPSTGGIPPWVVFFTHGLGGNLTIRGFLCVGVACDVMHSCFFANERDLRSRRRGEKGANTFHPGWQPMDMRINLLHAQKGGRVVCCPAIGGWCCPSPSSRLADRWRRSFWSKSIRWHGFYKGGAGKIFRSTLSHAKKGAVERCVRCSQAGRKDICTTAQQCEETWRVLAA